MPEADYLCVTRLAARAVASRAEAAIWLAGGIRPLVSAKPPGDPQEIG
jgi:hypothetical protein